MTHEEIKQELTKLGHRHAELADEEEWQYESVEMNAEWMIINYIAKHQIPTPGFAIKAWQETDVSELDIIALDLEEDPELCNDQTLENFHDLQHKLDNDPIYRKSLDTTIPEIIHHYNNAFGWGEYLTWKPT